jgi:hypothetical protein
MEASVDPQPWGPDWMPITHKEPQEGSFLHAETQSDDKIAAARTREREIKERYFAEKPAVGFWQRLWQWFFG